MRNLVLKIKINTRLTYLIIGANVIIWLIMEFLGGSQDADTLLTFGALENARVFDGEWWRLVTSAFLHIGIIHLIINSYSLYELGSFVESFFGQAKFLATYTITAITAGLLSLFLTNGISAGASGALFGLIGLLLGNAWAKKTYTFDLPIDEMRLIPFVAYNLVLGFLVPAINNWAHIGGLLGGIILGYVFDPAISFDPRVTKRVIAQILEKVALLILIVSVIFGILNVWGIRVVF